MNRQTFAGSRGRCASLVSLALLAVLLLPARAVAQFVLPGPTLNAFTIVPFPLRGVDGAYSPTHDAFLLVGGHNTIVGIFVNRGGMALGPAFTIKGPGNHGAFPRTAWSPHANGGAGAFLVIWGEEVGGAVISQLHTRLVAFNGGLGALVGTEGIIPQTTPGFPSVWLESGPALAYSSTSQVFFAAWKTYATLASGPVMVGQRIDVTGAAVGAPVQLSSGFGRDAGVAWNPNTNEFGVSFSTETASSVGTAFVRVPATNPEAFARNTFNVLPASAAITTITDLAFNTATGRFVMTWFQLDGSTGARVAEFDAAGNMLTPEGGGLASLVIGSYDALGVAYSPAAGTFLLVGVNRFTDHLIGAELNSRGFRVFGEDTLSVTSSPAYYTRVAAATNSPFFSAMFSGADRTAAIIPFSYLSTQPVSTTTTGGGPAGDYGNPPPPPPPPGGGEPPPPPPPPPGGCTTIQPASDWVCVNGGWVPPSTSGGGGGTTNPNCPSVQPASDWVCVNGGWVPPSTSGGSGGTTNPNCPSVQPASDWVCVNGGWVPPSTSGGGGGGGTTNPNCPSVQPGPDWVCVNGGWVPGGTTGGGGGGGTTNPNCPSVQPGPDWVCVNGGWIPGTGGGGGGGTTNPNCPSIQPGPDWVCVNGGWVPGTGGGGGGTTNPNCPSIQPGPDWVCVNGGWVPGTGGSTGGGGSTSGCTSIQPGADWVCVNGGWVPGTGGGSTGGGSTGGCTTVQPGTGWVCVNGGWQPPGSAGGGGCTTVQPGPDWVCSNGGWLPPGTVVGGVSTGGGGLPPCSTPAPVPGWVLVNGGWVPPDHPLAPLATCRG